MAPTIFNTPRGDVLPAGWQHIDIREWLRPHALQAQAAQAEPEVLALRQHGAGLREREAEGREAVEAPPAPSRPDQEDAVQVEPCSERCYDTKGCDCEHPPSTC